MNQATSYSLATMYNLTCVQFAWKLHSSIGQLLDAIMTVSKLVRVYGLNPFSAIPMDSICPIVRSLSFFNKESTLSFALNFESIMTFMFGWLAVGIN